MNISRRLFTKNRDDISSSDSESHSAKNLAKFELLNTSTFRRANFDRSKINSSPTGKFFIKISKEYQKSRESINQIFDQDAKKVTGGVEEPNMVHKTKMISKNAGLNGTIEQAGGRGSNTQLKLENNTARITSSERMGQSMNKKSTSVLKNKTQTKDKMPTINGYTLKTEVRKDLTPKEEVKSNYDEYSVEIPNFDEIISNSARLKAIDNSQQSKDISSIAKVTSTQCEQPKCQTKSTEFSPKTGKRILKSKSLKQDIQSNPKLEESPKNRSVVLHANTSDTQDHSPLPDYLKSTSCTRSHQLTPESSPETKRKLFLKKSKANSITGENTLKQNNQKSTQDSQNRDDLTEVRAAGTSPKLQKKSESSPAESRDSPKLKTRTLGIRTNIASKSPKISSTATSTTRNSATSLQSCTKTSGKLKSSIAVQNESSKEEHAKSETESTSLTGNAILKNSKLVTTKKTANITSVSGTEDPSLAAGRPAKPTINSERQMKADSKVQDSPALKDKTKPNEPNYIYDSTVKSHETKTSSPKSKIKLKTSQIAESSKLAAEISKNIKDKELSSPKLKIKTSKNLLTPVNKNESNVPTSGEMSKASDKSIPTNTSILNDLNISELNVIHDSSVAANLLSNKKEPAKITTKKEPLSSPAPTSQVVIHSKVEKSEDVMPCPAEIPTLAANSKLEDKLSPDCINSEMPSFQKSVLEINSGSNEDKTETICASLKTKKITIKDKSIVLREASLSSLIYPSQKERTNEKSLHLKEDFLNSASMRALTASSRVKEEDKGDSDSESSSESAKSSRRGSRRSCSLTDYKEFAALPNWKDEFLQSAVDYAMIRIHRRQPRTEVRRPQPVSGPVVSEISASWERRGSLEAQGLPSPGPAPRRTRRSAGGLDRHKPLKPFLTQGSVAERVWLFECLPQPALRPRHVLLKTWRSSGTEVQHKTQFWEVAKEESPAPSCLLAEEERSSHVIPPFYFPRGTPQSRAQTREQLERLASVFETFSGHVLTRDHFAVVAKACGLPLFWKYPLYLAAGDAEDVPCSKFLDFWESVVATCHDEASQFIRVLTRSPQRQYLLPEDFLPMVQDLIETHPGLVFLKEATEFHSRYVHTVIARIYYCVNRSWSGKITLPELRNSNFLKVVATLEDEEDINQVTQYFSYEHFYVIYCKFWELDRDHDLYISKADLRRHADGAISNRMIDRIFSRAVSRSSGKDPMMSYTEFVWFLLSEEDKRHPRSIEYWFRCMDLDGDGFLSMYELEYFYREQLRRMDVLGIEALAFDDCLCQMLDMIKPREEGKISLSDLKRCRGAPLFFDAFFNIEKFLDHEQRDPFATLRDQDPNGKEMSDWDHYAAEEYELLVAEENNSDVLEDCNDPDAKEKLTNSAIFSKNLYSDNEDDVLI